MESLNIRFSGSGGQGLILAARILATALVDQGRNVAQSQSYEPVSRGGLSRSDLVVSDGEADYPLSQSLDYLLILDEAAANESADLLDDGSLILVDADQVKSPPTAPFNVVVLPFVETARRLGNKRVANIVALGALSQAADLCETAVLERVLKEKTPAKFTTLNQEAFAAGRQLIAS